MIRFLTPIRGAVSSDVEARYRMLSEAPSVLRLGGELILLEDDYTKEDLIAENLRNNIFPIRSVHVPFPQVGENYLAYDPRLPEGQEKIRAAANIAMLVGAKVVVVHSQLAFSLENWQPEQFSLAWRDNVFAEIFSVVKLFQQEFPALQFCLENMPLPLFADSVIAPSDIRFNPCLITFEDMIQAVEAEVMVTFDICHYDMMRRLWHSWLDRYQIIDQAIIKEQEGIVGIYPAGEQPNYLEVLKKLGARLGHIHLADSIGLWENTTSIPAGGLALGTGDQNAKELLSLLQYLESNSTKEYTINLEVKDKNMQSLEETAQSLQYLAQLLYAQKT